MKENRLTISPGITLYALNTMHNYTLYTYMYMYKVFNYSQVHLDHNITVVAIGLSHFILQERKKKV